MRRTPPFAFTLIELLVVISIIALLMSILLPTLSSARESARAVQCLSRLRQVGLALEMYADGHGGMYPPKKYTDDDGDTGSSLYLYLGDGGVGSVGGLTYGDFLADDRPLNPYINAEDGGSAIAVTRCPSDENLWQQAGTSYASNTYIIDDDSDGVPDVGNLLPPAGEAASAARGAVQQPSSFVTVSEPGLTMAMFDDDPPTFSQPGLGLDGFGDLFWHSNQRRWNAVFADGHAAGVNVEDYWSNTGSRAGDGYTMDWTETP